MDARDWDLWDTVLYYFFRGPDWKLAASTQTNIKWRQSND